MNLKICLEMNELERCGQHTFYNHICYSLKHPLFGITHIIEKYDDLGESPDYWLGHYPNSKFEQITQGYGDPINEKMIGFGGCWIEITLERPDLFKPLCN